MRQRPPGPWATRAIAAALALLAFVATAPIAAAQEAEPAAAAPAPEPQKPLVIPISEIANEAESLERRVAAASELAEPDPDFEDLRGQVAAFGGEFSEQALQVEQRIEEGLSLVDLNAFGEKWKAEAQHLDAWTRELDERVDALERTRAELAEAERRWDATLAKAREDAAPVEVIAAARAASSPIREAERAVTRRLGQLFSLQQQLATVSGQVREERARLSDAVAAAQQKLFVREREPLWDSVLGSSGGEGAAPGSDAGAESAPASDSEAGGDPEPEAGSGGAEVRGIFEVVLGALGAAFVSFRGYWLSERAPLGVMSLCLLAALAGVFALRQRAAVWAGDAARAESALLLRNRPLSMGVLTGLLVAWLFVDPYPEPVQQVMGLLFLIPVLRVLSALVPESSSAMLGALAIFYVVDRIRAIVTGFPIAERLLLLFEVVAAFAALLWIVWPWRKEQPGAKHIGNPTLIRMATRFGLAVLAASMLANVVGAVDLARLLADGAFSAAYLGVALLGVHHLLVALWVLLLRSDFGRSSRMARFHPLRMERTLSRALGILGTLAWLHLVLGFFSVRDSLYQSGRSVLEAEATLGDFSLSLGDVVGFVLTVYAAWALSKTIRFVLEQEFFPRVELQRGVPNTLSTVLHYALLLLGIYVALAVAGVDLSRLALVVGALSVGIGFGLQNVVNNFVSGLILLFERPVQVGDSVELGTMWGEVRRIGIRSSTLRTWDGAEVIVPNADLISNHVSNWTLSDRKRRMILPVGVAYGTDPERVIGVLLEVVEEVDGILNSPKPVALFRGFGDSSLDFELRCWIADADQWLIKLSEANLAIHRKLKQAGVEIPFPQRDLHLRSVAPNLQPGASDAAAEAANGGAVDGVSDGPADADD